MGEPMGARRREEEEKDEGEAAMEQLVLELGDRLGLIEPLRALSQRNQVRLTPAANLMLLVPLYEARLLRARRDFYGYGHEKQRDVLRGDLPTVERSLEELLTTARDLPAAAEEDLGHEFTAKVNPTRSALSIVKALWKRFCNIPPFCGESRP